MHVDELLDLMRTLRCGHHPLSGRPVAAPSCLLTPSVQQNLDRFIADVSASAPAPLPQSPRDRPTTSDRPELPEITGLRDDLRRLGYRPQLKQLVRVFLGSRSIADPELRGLPAYRRYRGLLTRKEMTELLLPHREIIEGSQANPKRTKRDKPYAEVDFFRSTPFDKLSAAKAEEIGGEVERLGMRKATEKLPAYMARARQRLPRAFEPWSREERALLIEAMCYTNDSERLAPLFGRSAASLRDMGKKLIWNSRRESQVIGDGMTK
jgi:hypothetical protein